jgi:hypothetical protein
MHEEIESLPYVMTPVGVYRVGETVESFLDSILEEDGIHVPEVLELLVREGKIVEA